MTEKVAACVRFFRRVGLVLQFASYVALIALALTVFVFMFRARQEVRAMHTEVVDELRAIRVNQDTIVGRILRQLPEDNR